MIKIKIFVGLIIIIASFVFLIKNRGKSMMDKLMDKSKDNPIALDSATETSDDEKKDR
ncbi:MAG: hypothetical protein HXL88_00965 [[Eubacterium] sulci]|nr:hypothetical protein [[Eubacterium] sulci]